MKPSEILTPENWIKNAYGKFPDGTCCNTNSRFELRELAQHFVSMCMLGACVKCGLEEGVCVAKLSPIVNKHFPNRWKDNKMSDFNDHEDTTLKDVLMVLKEAGL